MKKVTVQASQTYDILIERGLLDQMRRARSPRSTPGAGWRVITDDNVDQLYGDRVCRSLENAGLFPLACMVIPPGERSKSLATCWPRSWSFWPGRTA